MVERANKEVMRHLRSIIFEKNVIDDWSDNLPMIQRHGILNVSENENIGVSASQILFGNMIDLNRGIFLPQDERSVQSYSKWLSDRLEAQNDIISKAQTLQKEQNDKHMSTISNKLTIFNIGDMVLVDYPPDQLKPGPPSKLMTNRLGPMEIVGKTDNNMFYTLKDITNNKSEDTIHVTRLHTFYYDPIRTDPRQIANRDTQEFDIDEILEHTGDKNIHLE
jgi:ribosomal protein L21E